MLSVTKVSAWPTRGAQGWSLDEGSGISGALISWSRVLSRGSVVVKITDTGHSLVSVLTQPFTGSVTVGNLPNWPVLQFAPL